MKEIGKSYITSEPWYSLAWRLLLCLIAVTVLVSQLTVTRSRCLCKDTSMHAEDQTSLLSVKSVNTGPDIINSEVLESPRDFALLTRVPRTGSSGPGSHSPTFAI